MKKPNFAKFSPFMVDPAPIEEMFEVRVRPEYQERATETEKESIVEKHKSVSYWRDAWRRFRKNTVSMVALVIFILILLFAFVGPLLIPYDYEEQYRESMDLGPMEYSAQEKEYNQFGKINDGYFATAMAKGSRLKKGSYYISYEGKTYAFTLKTSMRDAVLLFNHDAENPLVRMDRNREGVWEDVYIIEVSDTAAEGAEKIELMHRVFPHYFGTDAAGRDLLARTMDGAQVSITIGVFAALIVLVIGSIYGAISGLAGGVTDFIMMRFVELIYSIPEMLIVLLLQVVLKSPDQDNPSGLQQWLADNRDGTFKFLSDLGIGIISIFITFAMLYWVTMARIVRGQVLQLKKQEYVNAAVALGAGKWRIIRRHLLPNAIGALVITTCLQIPSAIFLESFLSFLGMGVSSPRASLGSLCSDAKELFIIKPYLLILPAAVLTLIVLTLNLVGDGLRDALDPRLKQ